jgi:hypothetical protein
VGDLPDRCGGLSPSGVGCEGVAQVGVWQRGRPGERTKFRRVLLPQERRVARVIREIRWQVLAGEAGRLLRHVHREGPGRL